MYELSPEEIRWQMQEIEKTGMLNEAQKQRFQQLRQQLQPMKEVTEKTIQGNATMLKNTVGNSTTSTTGSTPSFSLAAPQLVVPENSTNMFSNETFGAQNNPLGAAFNSNNNIFGRPTENSAPIFGGTPSFGNPLTMASPPNANPVFGENKPNLFGGGQTTQTFGSLATQSGLVFGGAAPQSFGQTSTFGAATNQTTNIFARPQTSQSVISNATPTNNPIFGNATPQAPPLFGDSKPVAGNIFGGSGVKSTNPVFGGATTSGNMAQSANIFGQTKTSSVFGGAPVFGSGSKFYNASGSIFGGGQASFAGNNQAGSIFGGPAQSAFGTVNQAPNAFGTATSGAPSVPPQNVPTTAPFGQVSSQFGMTNTNMTAPFSQPAFGAAKTAVSSATYPTGIPAANNRPATTVPSPFATNVFAANSNPTPSLFASTATTTTTTSANPFAPRSQPTNSPFGPVSQSQINAGPFGKSAFDSTSGLTIVPDDSMYSAEGTLTDDEKSMYLAEQFTFGKIPLKPPTKDLM